MPDTDGLCFFSRTILWGCHTWGRVPRDDPLNFNLTETIIVQTIYIGAHS